MSLTSLVSLVSPVSMANLVSLTGLVSLDELHDISLRVDFAGASLPSRNENVRVDFTRPNCNRSYITLWVYFGRP